MQRREKVYFISSVRSGVRRQTRSVRMFNDDRNKRLHWSKFNTISNISNWFQLSQIFRIRLTPSAFYFVPTMLLFEWKEFLYFWFFNIKRSSMPGCGKTFFCCQKWWQDFLYLVGESTPISEILSCFTYQKDNTDLFSEKSSAFQFCSLQIFESGIRQRSYIDKNKFPHKRRTSPFCSIRLF